MDGIDLNRPVLYGTASFRYFAPREHHVARICEDDVLLLVFEGCLRFEEEDASYEVRAGEYFIQRKGGRQGGRMACDSPRYLYVHFTACWGEGETCLPRRGRFSPEELMPLMTRLDGASHENLTLTEQAALFYQILAALHRSEPPSGKGAAIARYLRENFRRRVTLEELSEAFGYSKNQIINILCASYGTTPVAYLNRLRIKEAEWLMRVTPKTLAQVAEECGYGDYSRFYKVFFACHGCSPAQWRAQNRE